MNIQPVTPYQNTYRPNFQGNIENLFKPIQGAKICKRMTEFDRSNLIAYLNMKPFMTGITTKEIDELSKFDGEDFIRNAGNLIMTRLRIPESIRPRIIFDKIPGDGIMAYSAMTNFLIADLNKTKNFGKNTVFGILRHEITHLQQNMAVLRHETIGEKAVVEYSTTAAPILKNLLISNFAQVGFNVDRAVETGIISKENRYLLDNAMKFYNAGDKKGFDRYIEEEIYKDQLAEMTELRKKIIETCDGKIPDGVANEQLEAAMNEFAHNGYMDTETHTVDYSKYAVDALENEAMITQTIADFEFSKMGCFIKHQKEAFIKALNEPNSRKIIEASIPD